MKNAFFEYYPINQEIIDNAWNNGVFCYDANVLLNLYRYTNDTRNKIFENIEYFIDKTVMPYQACYEYHKNRRIVVDRLQNSYDEIIKIIDQNINSIESGELTKYRKHCALDIEKDIIKPFKSTATKIISKINTIKANHTQYLNAAEVHEKITKLFDGKISKRFSDEDLKKIYSEGKNRYEKKIPPGFADYAGKKNADENSLYGDLIIWKHLIAISQEKKTDIIFITDDRKKDWWDIYHGETKGALPELYREFKELTSHYILIYSVEDYMKYARGHSEISVPKKVINEIEELRKVDERKAIYDFIKEINNNMETNFHDNIEMYKEIIKSINYQNTEVNSIYYQALSKIMEKSQYIDYMKALTQAVQQANSLIPKELAVKETFVKSGDE